MPSTEVYGKHPWGSMVCLMEKLQVCSVAYVDLAQVLSLALQHILIKTASYKWIGLDRLTDFKNTILWKNRNWNHIVSSDFLHGSILDLIQLNCSHQWSRSTFKNFDDQICRWQKWAEWKYWDRQAVIQNNRDNLRSWAWPWNFHFNMFQCKAPYLNTQTTEQAWKMMVSVLEQ